MRVTNETLTAFMDSSLNTWEEPGTFDLSLDLRDARAERDELLRQARRAMGRLNMSLGMNDDSPAQAASDAWDILHAVVVNTEAENG